ncbi:hypothetical protein B0H63DRAFT_510110 [Podospora didyma]|uniref:Uncharacterized protein n=1 Tax=Podospora didyma TaxID=330526 RepID=A0AAE0TZG0_9PEZI|nr:hypothetical protein B0H63DRAFT_510110 [Podospora didyma]
MSGWNKQRVESRKNRKALARYSYFAGVHIIREMTQFFAHIRDGRAETLKRLLWKIQGGDDGGDGKGEDSKELKKVFGWYEEEFQQIIYRRFKYLYLTEWEGHENPQGYEKMKASLGKDDEEARKKLDKEEGRIKGSVRRCKMVVDKKTLVGGTLKGASQYRIPCDCYGVGCNLKKEDFEHCDLTISIGRD